MQQFIYDVFIFYLPYCTPQNTIHLKDKKKKRTFNSIQCAALSLRQLHTGHLRKVRSFPGHKIIITILKRTTLVQYNGYI